MNKRYNPKDLSEYDKYDQEMKMSVCRAAFELAPYLPPHEKMFHLARSIGYPIPEKWKDMYHDG